MRQTGGRGQYGHCIIETNLRARHRIYLCYKITGGAIPKEYISAIDSGIQDAMNSGLLGGYQVLDVLL